MESINTFVTDNRTTKSIVLSKRSTCKKGHFKTPMHHPAHSTTTVNKQINDIIYRPIIHMTNYNECCHVMISMCLSKIGLGSDSDHRLFMCHSQIRITQLKTVWSWRKVGSDHENLTVTLFIFVPSSSLQKYSFS